MTKRHAQSARTTTMLAAGGLVVRESASGTLEVAVIHRPGVGDWSLPKGKLEANETLEECAVREVREETGLLCQLGAFAGRTAYADRRGRPKIVSYWLMQPLTGSFEPTHEVDALQFLPVEEAIEVLSYDLDRELLRNTDLPRLAVVG